MYQKAFPVIDPVATGANIVRLRIQRGLSVRDLQAYFGFEEPQAIYKWQKGKSLPSVDNLYALGALLEVPMDEILVSARPKLHMIVCEQQADACCSSLFRAPSLRGPRRRQKQKPAEAIFRSAPGAPRRGGCRSASRALPQRAASVVRPSARAGRSWRCACDRVGGRIGVMAQVAAARSAEEVDEGSLPVFQDRAGFHDRLDPPYSAQAAQSSNVQHHRSSAPEPAAASPLPCRIHSRRMGCLRTSGQSPEKAPKASAKVSFTSNGGA